MDVVLAQILKSIEITTAFCIVMFVAMLGNSVIGAFTANKRGEFSWKILWRGLYTATGMILGFDFVGAAIVAVPALLKHYGLQIPVVDKLLAGFNNILWGINSKGIVVNIEDIAVITILLSIIIFITYKNFIRSALEKAAKWGNISLIDPKKYEKPIADENSTKR